MQVATIAWNSGEVFVTITLGIAARSLALVAFGLDSLIEVFASGVVIWHMREPEGVEGRLHIGERDRRGNRLVAAAFGILTVYLVVSAAVSLMSHRVPVTSPWGVVYLAATTMVMLVLAHLKRRTGKLLNNEIFLAEARMTQLDAYLAISIMAALLANQLFGWWWADALSAAVVGVFAASESASLIRASNQHQLTP